MKNSPYQFTRIELEEALQDAEMEDPKTASWVSILIWISVILGCIALVVCVVKLIQVTS